MLCQIPEIANSAMKKSLKSSLSLAVDCVPPASIETMIQSQTAPVDGQEMQGVWAEPQLFLLPFCVPQDKAADRYRQVEITEKVRVNGQLRERAFRVNPDAKLGLPGPFELEVMIAIYQVAATYINQTGAVPEYIELGSLRSFLESMGRATGGSYVAMLKEALKRLASTTCVSEGFFYSKPRDLYLIQSFQFITEVQITGETDFSGKRYEKTVVRLHEFIRDNLNSNFRTLIDFRYIRSLKTDIAKTLSLHLSYRFHKHGQGSWEADYSWLAERLAIKVYPDVKMQKRQFKSSLEELQKTGFLDKWEWLPNGRIRFYAGSRYLDQHFRRVAAKDAWLLHQEDFPKQLSLLPSNEIERLKEKFDPLDSICAKFAVFGWKAVEAQAKEKQLTLEQIKAETVNRGFAIQVIQ